MIAITDPHEVPTHETGLADGPEVVASERRESKRAKKNASEEDFSWEEAALGCLPVVMVPLLLMGCVTIGPLLNTRVLGGLFVIGGLLFGAAMLTYGNAFVRVRNSILFFPLAIVSVIGGAATLILGEIPAWLNDWLNDLFQRLNQR